MKKALCFITDPSFSKQCITAVESAKRWNPDYDVVYCDSPSMLNIDPANWLITGRPELIRQTLATHELVVFLDGDTFTYGPFDAVEWTLSLGISMLVTPHIQKPLPDDGRFPAMSHMNYAGNYNAGFFAATPEALPFVEWWAKQTLAYPQIDPPNNLFAEQGWLRYALDFDRNASILRHPGYNVAYWNICDRTVERHSDGCLIDGVGLRLMHFSGMRKEIPPAQMSCYQNRHMLQPGDPRLAIYEEYHQRVFC